MKFAFGMVLCMADAVTVTHWSLGMYAVSWKDSVRSRRMVLDLIKYHAMPSNNYQIVFLFDNDRTLTIDVADAYYSTKFRDRMETHIYDMVSSAANGRVNGVLASSMEEAETIKDIIMKAHEWEILLG